MVPKAQPEHKDRKAQREPKVLRVHRVQMALRDRKEARELPVPKALQDQTRLCRDPKALPALKEQQVVKEPRAQLVRRVLKEPLLVWQVPRERRGHKAQRALRELQEPKVPLELRVPRAHLVAGQVVGI